MNDREKVIRGLECIGGYRHMETNPCAECGYNECQTFAICVGEVARDALELLKGRESEWLEDSDLGQEYGTTWACRRCMHSIHERNVWNPYDSGYKYCPHCGAEMKVK